MNNSVKAIVFYKFKGLSLKINFIDSKQKNFHHIFLAYKKSI